MPNRGWIVAKASAGKYDPQCLELEDRDIPVLPDGKVLVRSLLLSLDPTSRNWLKLDPRMQYIPFGIGDPMLGMAVGEVVEARAPGFAPGDLVKGMWGWQEYAIADPAYLEPVADRSRPLETSLSLFSHVGRAAVMGLIGVGHMVSSDAVLISGAAGATGSIAAQVARSRGCRVVGIAGGDDKCRYLRDELGLDGVIDYRQGDLAASVRNAFPEGVDLFFDNVGGEILDVVLDNMAIGCRIVICGAISQYDLPDPAAAYGVKNLPLMLFRRARMEGFVVPQFADRYAEFDAILSELYEAGKLAARSHIIDGLELAPEALELLFSGRNAGKLIIRVAETGSQ